MKKTVGRDSYKAIAHEEILTTEACKVSEGSTFSLYAFYILNQSNEDVGIAINGGDYIKLKSGEMYDLSGLTEVVSCKVDTDAIIRWGGLI